MKPGWIIGLAMIFVIMQIISGVCEAQTVGPDEMTTLQRLLSPEFPDVKIPVIGHIAGFVSMSWEYIQVLWTMFWFDYPFFTGSWALLRYILFIPVSIGLVVSLVLATVRGVSG